MGNCLKSPTSDDISLLHESQSDRASFGDANDPDQEPPPPYQGLDINLAYDTRHAVQTDGLPVVLFFSALYDVFIHRLYCDKEQIHVPVYHPTPSQARLATQLTEEEQVRIAQRIGLIQHLPRGVYDPGSDGSEKKIRECVICMMDFVYGDPIRFLPCMHIYHLDCIDDWLMRSFTCPSCMEPVDAALLSSYETN
ncbi:RING finger protein 11 [Triplophysa tibetana]|uniref:RING finger protein 11 n=1 Tax=Triplophysa tibetana TaxID=1572043 RepID=A0A5A9NXA2_9TELE|nr:RING finger protein 11 [Triplophysa tibetana]